MVEVWCVSPIVNIECAVWPWVVAWVLPAARTMSSIGWSLPDDEVSTQVKPAVLLLITPRPTTTNNNTGLAALQPPTHAFAGSLARVPPLSDLEAVFPLVCDAYVQPRDHGHRAWPGASVSCFVCVMCGAPPPPPH